MPGFPMYAAEILSDEFFTGRNKFLMISKSVDERDQQTSSKKYLGNSEDVVTWTCFMFLLLLHNFSAPRCCQNGRKKEETQLKE
jgi:hypothetical protein